MKFSIVTPTFNAEKYLSETITSIVLQKGKFSVELLVIDNNSSDKTHKIVADFQEKLKDGTLPIACDSVEIRWFSEADKGMYQAINKGFSLATGQILAWANSDDIYLPGAFDMVQKTFNKFPEIRWLKGVTSYIDDNSRLIRQGTCYLYYQRWIAQGVYGRKLYFLQQSSTFWKAGLWRESGGINPEFKLAGDYELWTKFARLTPLYTLNFNTDCFRFRPGQLSEDKKGYFQECDQIAVIDKKLEAKIDRYKNLRGQLPGIFQGLLYFILFGLQVFYLIDIVNWEEKPRLVKRKYRLYNFWGTRY